MFFIFITFSVEVINMGSHTRGTLTTYEAFCQGPCGRVKVSLTTSSGYPIMRVYDEGGNHLCSGYGKYGACNATTQNDR